MRRWWRRQHDESFAGRCTSNMNAPHHLAAQVVERVKTLNFGANVVPPVTINYPIDFFPLPEDAI